MSHVNSQMIDKSHRLGSECSDIDGRFSFETAEGGRGRGR